MAEIKQTDQREFGAPQAAQAMRAGNEAVRRSAVAGTEAVNAGAEGIERSSQATAEALRQDSQSAAEAVKRTANAAGDMARLNVQAAGEGGRHLAEEAANHFEATGRKLASAVQDSTADMRRLMLLPHHAEGGLRDAQQAWGGIVDGFMRTNIEATQSFIRMADFGAVIDLQRRFARQYLDAVLEGQVTFLRAMRRTAEETLRPLEAQIEQRQAEVGRHDGSSLGGHLPRGRQDASLVTA